MKFKNFDKLDFKKFHPGGSLSVKLKTVGDLMRIGNKIPFVNENTPMKRALIIISKKELGVLIIRNKKKITSGILTDGDLKRLAQRKWNFLNLKIKSVMKKNPITIDKDMLAVQALSIMNSKKVTSLCVHSGKVKYRSVGIIHIHDILRANIN